MTPNIQLEIYTVNDRALPDRNPFWSGIGWTSGYQYGLDRKEPGELENFKLEVRILSTKPLDLNPGQRVKCIFLGESIEFNLVKAIRTIGGLTILRLDTLP